ncbi:MAG: TAT-variant-translocated molybdopterin oxidoreductase [Pyrinomonadaceae bacterium]
MPSQDHHINFALMRDRILAEQNGKEYWRSLEELADTEEFREFISREYPHQAEEWDDDFSRRTFIKLMGASLALAGLSGCVYQPPEKIVPYVRQPEESVPGKALFFATAMQIGGIATGLLAKSNEGRPTKLEGNPDHPDSQGATDVWAQASILTLYDPDRSQTLSYREEIRPWSTFLGEMRSALEQMKATSGAGLRILTETVSSPTMAAQLKSILTAFPSARWHQYEPASRNNAYNGALTAFGQAVNTIYRFENADRILSIDSDFLSCGPGNLRNAREFARKRRVEDNHGEMNRLYAVECTPTNTGAKADHRLSIRPSEVESFTRALAQMLGVNTGGQPATLQSGERTKWIDAVARDLKAHAGASLVIVGDEQSPAVHALGHAINAALGNVGKTVIYTDPVEANPVDQTQSLRELVGDLNNGTVELLVIIGGNPVYNAPADLSFEQAMQKAKTRVHLSLYKDETSELCHWHIPEAHYLESWGDARAFDGTVSIVQPLIEPLYGDNKTANELLAVFTDQYDQKPYDMLRNFWTGAGGQGLGVGRNATAPNPASSNQTSDASADTEQQWRKWVHDGIIPNTALPQKTVALKSDWSNQPLTPNPQSPTPNALEIVFRTDPTIHDGRFANNGWLQELPKPLTKLTWDNAAMLSLNTAQRLGVTTEIGRKGGDHYVDVVYLNYKGRMVAAPIWILPGQPDDVVTVHLGYGRALAGRVGGDRNRTVGFNAYKIRTSDAPWSGEGLTLTKAGQRYQMATTQLHFNMEGRDIVRSYTLEQMEEKLHNPEHERAEREKEEKELKDASLYPQYDYKNQGFGYAWGMAIDNASCVGCNACVVACQSENNIPIVGKEQIVRSREMQWLRIDTYYKGDDANNPEETHFMPVPCMHCENAPCEPVCPVHATVHSAEGTNDMVYNRCVGTRYCSNNCPYKVRRFNFLLYQDWDTPTYKLMRNPEVSVRSRGVMEKCTYCIQRIQWAKIESEKEGRTVRDGEIVTACQAVCPTEAIVFGNINDPNSKVSKLKEKERHYALLAELNTQPRTTYLAGLRNPNPELSEKA